MAKVTIKRMYRQNTFGDLGPVKVTFHAFGAAGEHVLSKTITGKLGTPDSPSNMGYFIEIGGMWAQEIHAEYEDGAVVEWEAQR